MPLLQHEFKSRHLIRSSFMLLTVFIIINLLGRGENKHNSGKENIFVFSHWPAFHTPPLHQDADICSTFCGNTHSLPVLGNEKIKD